MNSTISLSLPTARIQTVHTFLLLEKACPINPSPFESIPKFQDRVRIGDAFKGAMLDVMLLVLFFNVLFAMAHVSFQRKEI